MTRLDVLMVGPFPTDPARIEGGVQASLYGLARHLKAREDIASLRVVATPKRVGTEISNTTIAGIDVTFINAPWRFLVSTVLNVPQIVRMIAETPNPLVHLHGSGLFEAAVMAACRWKGIPIVWTLHGITEKETHETWRRNPSPSGYVRHLIYKFCERFQLRTARELIVDTPYVARAVADRATAQPVAIPQGIFLDELEGAESAERPGHTVLALGVIDPRKGHRQTIEAFAAVLKKVPDARLKVVGALTSTAYLAELHETIFRLGVRDRVEILPDQARERVLAALAEARVFALHSQEESQGIAICEAMAVGLPVVSTTSGGIPDVVGDSGAGLLVDYGDIEGFADHIVAVLTDDEVHGRMSAAARRRGAEFDWVEITRRIVERYEAAIGNGRGRKAPTPAVTRRLGAESDS
ncbi:MAG: glycosyltransferase family 4 protein [Siculibacillus sp.]